MSVADFAWLLSDYAIDDPSEIVTPALLIYPERVQRNIQTTIHQMLGGEAGRWRPHIKTAKLAATIKEYLRQGVRHFKCSTTLELKTALEAGAQDVLVAIAMVGANARRVRELAATYAAARVSVLVESAQQLEPWLNSPVFVYLDLNSGMNRTGMEPGQIGEMIQLARQLGVQFSGLHWYDGHVSMLNGEERKAKAFASYDGLMKIVDQFREAGIPVSEIITSGTPSAPYGIGYPGFQDQGFHKQGFVHRVSPGTVVYNDLSSLKQLPDYPLVPAALVLTSVISHPKSGMITCDAGHKAVSVDSGVPTCAVVGYPDLVPQKPSEEHLPIEVPAGGPTPAIGDKLYLVPKHVCPTVNNFDQALMIRQGKVVGVEPVSARGHESPLRPG